MNTACVPDFLLRRDALGQGIQDATVGCILDFVALLA